jgi:hypothetical protein
VTTLSYLQPKRVQRHQNMPIRESPLIQARCWCGRRHHVSLVRWLGISRNLTCNTPMADQCDRAAGRGRGLGSSGSHTAGCLIHRAFCRRACAMLPCCERTIHISRDKYLPSHNRGIQVPKEPTTVGGHLRRRRLQLRIYQPEAARRLGVSMVSLSRWECDKGEVSMGNIGAVRRFPGVCLVAAAVVAG